MSRYIKDKNYSKQPALIQNYSYRYNFAADAPNNMFDTVGNYNSKGEYPGTTDQKYTQYYFSISQNNNANFRYAEVKMHALYHVKAPVFVTSSTDNIKIKNVVGSLITVIYKGKQLEIDSKYETVSSNDFVAELVPFENGAVISITGTDYDSGTFTLQGAYNTANVKYLYMDNDNIVLDYKSTEARININDILFSKGFLQVSSININTGDTNIIENIGIDDEYTVVRHTWDTGINTLSYYWINKEHILEITTSELIIYEKTTAFDDWLGNTLSAAHRYNKSAYISNTCITYGMSSVCGTDNAYFYTMEAVTNKKLCITVYDVLDNMKAQTILLYVNGKNGINRTLGEPLVSDYTKACIESYQSITAGEILTNAKVTCTLIDNKLLFGFAIDKALSQWTVFCNIGPNRDVTFDHILTGYGYVGPDGSITGGEIPEIAFDINKGFTGTVKPLSELFKDNANEDKTSAINGDFKITGIYGNEKQHWYIYKSIDRIVSHLKYNKAMHIHEVVYIPIGHKYVADYASTSFYVNKIRGLVPQATTLFGLIPYGEKTALKHTIEALTAICNPTIWFLDPNWAKFGYLQQSIGQYSYVYYNSSDNLVGNVKNENEDMSSTKEPTLQIKDSRSLLDTFKNEHKILTKDELSFDKQVREQTIETNTEKARRLGFLYSLLMSGLGTAVQAIPAVKVNETQNQTSTNDIAKQFSQFAMENALTTAASDIGVAASTGLAMASKVVAVKTLDMFYSVSANNKMYAGPGYVCHRFIAQCIAQSVSNRFVQATQTGMFTVLTPLSIIDLQIKNLVLKVSNDCANTIAEGALSSGAALTLKGIASVATGIAALTIQAVTKEAIEMNNFFIEILPDIINCIKTADAASFINYGNISSHNIDIEAKHAYGSKHLDLMWPCFNTESTTMTVEEPQVEKHSTKAAVDFSNKSGLAAEWLNSSSKTSVMTFNGLLIDSKGIDLAKGDINDVTSDKNNTFKETLQGDVYAEYIYVKGVTKAENNQARMPEDMAVIEGTTAFLPVEAFKNENINCEKVFTVEPVQDYVINDKWEIGITANQTGAVWVSCRDTKLIDGEYSNVIFNDEACLIACPYTAIEVMQGIHTEYLRPYAVSPTALAWNITGLNVCYDNEMYHGFDGVGYRITEWHGSAGLDKEFLTYYYCLQSNNRFKRGNILPPGQFLGSYNCLASNGIVSRDPIYTTYRVDNLHIGAYNMLPNENREQTRYAIPLFTDVLSTLPTVVKTLSSHSLLVYEGITSLTTTGRITQGDYKVPKTVDFAINKQIFRATNEYICMLNSDGLPAGEIVATLGLKFIGATPMQAFFYSDATRAYYVFTGAANLTKQDIWNRFKDIKDGKWDFVNHEVVFQCLGNMTRLYDDTSDIDEDASDNLFIAHLNNNGISGDITPPNKAIFNPTYTGSWFKTYSFSGGLAFQGPNRFIVNRFICLDYMLEDIVNNRKKWKRVSKDKFSPFREYKEDFNNVTERIEDGVNGWTHNPFLLCTAPLGVDEDTDCMYEWELVFTWTDEMDILYKDGSYACVNIMAQTMCPGGKKRSDITHLYLTKELFTRSDNTGYYSFRFSSRNGAGNREQLFIWSDAYIAMSSLSVEYKVITSRRQTPLATSQVDIKELSEF